MTYDGHSKNAHSSRPQIPAHRIRQLPRLTRRENFVEFLIYRWIKRLSGVARGDSSSDACRQNIDKRKGGRLTTPAPNQTTQTTTLIRRQIVLCVQKIYLRCHISLKNVFSRLGRSAFFAILSRFCFQAVFPGAKIGCTAHLLGPNHLCGSLT